MIDSFELCLTLMSKRMSSLGDKVVKKKTYKNANKNVNPKLPVSFLIAF